jgi:predicted metal-dependent peptidase
VTEASSPGPGAWRGAAPLTADLRQRWAAGRVWAARQAPYLASALLSLEPVVVEEAGPELDLSAFPVDRAWHIYLSPACLAQVTVPNLGFWLVHQVSHLLRRHAERYPPGDSQETEPLKGARSIDECRWNVATDAEIDDDISAGEITVPDGAITPSQIFCPDGWVAEQYWDALGGQSPSMGQVPGGLTRQAADADAPAGACALERGIAGTWGRVDCGSGCAGRPRPWDCGAPGLGATAQKVLAREVARRIKEHSRQRGDVPAGWQRWAEEVLEPIVNWRRLLAAAVRRGMADVAGKVDFTYRKPSRRAVALPGVVLPSLRVPIPQVVVVLDTSGSMSDAMLGQALAEVGGVLRGLGVGRQHLRVVCCDAEAYGAQRVLAASEVRLLGGGGTDMGVGLAAAAALRPRPDLVIVLTDGHTPWPASPPPRTRVVVGLMGPTGRVPGWATTVEIQPDVAVEAR